jgi:plastocyanin
VIARALATAVAAALLVPAVADAAVTRSVQALDTPTFRTIWTPKTVPAQVGDTIEWRLTQPGNPNAATHDVWLVPPGGSAVQLGASYLAPTATYVVDQVGTYDFYCSIHGALAPGAMNGQVIVTEEDPGAPVDPGTPWTDPNWEDPDDPGGGPAWLQNPTQPPAVFEEGDNTPPTLTIAKVKLTKKAAKVTASASEPGTLTVRLKRGRKIIATTIADFESDAITVKVTLPKKLRAKERRYRLQVWATDAVDLESEIDSRWVTLGGE